MFLTIFKYYVLYISICAILLYNWQCKRFVYASITTNRNEEYVALRCDGFITRRWEIFSSIITLWGHLYVQAAVDWNVVMWLMTSLGIKCGQRSKCNKNSIIRVDNTKGWEKALGHSSILDTSFYVFDLMCSWLRFFLRFKVNFVSGPQRSNMSMLISCIFLLLV